MDNISIREDKIINTPEQNREIQKILAERWKEYDEDFRISAVIHDGQWYTKDKWKRVAKLKKMETLDNWIKKNKNKIISHENGLSFRTSKDEIIKWYKENDLDITKELVPKNYPPRIWNNKTETEAFLDCPKETVSNLLLKSDDKELTEKIINYLQPYSQIKEDEQHKVYFYTMNAEYLKYKVEKLLTEKELKKCDIRVRHNFGRRELADFEETFLVNILEFYYVLSITLLKSHQNTMKIFLPDQFDRSAQIYEWIIKALQKFDEEAGVPFSGYLASVLNKWPYDLPDNTLGKPMAIYQRKRAQIVKKYKTDSIEEIPIDILREELNMYTDEQFRDFENWHHQWLKIQGASNLNWEDKNAEKVGENITTKESTYYVDNIVRSKIIRSIILTCVKTKQYETGIKILNDLFRLENFNEIEYIDSSFKEVMKKELEKIMNEKH